MRIEKQYIGKDKYGNLQLLVKTKSNKYYILQHTNLLGFTEITKEEFIEHIKRE